MGIFTNSTDHDTYDDVVNRRSGMSPIKSEGSEGASSECTQTSLLLEGPTIFKLTDEDWNVVCDCVEIVFARTSPE